MDERFCKLCLTLNENHIEDEYHVCPFYEDLTKTYIYVSIMILLIYIPSLILCTLEEIVQRFNLQW